MADAPRLLIVDDEAPLMKALCDTLRDAGYETVGFSSGTAALAALADTRFDLILADLMMPGMDGITLLKAALQRDPDLVGVIMTGAGAIATAVEAMKAGALDYILKPFNLTTILPVLERAGEVRRLRLENTALERSVRRHASELEIMNRDLELFSSSVAHDLRAPLRRAGDLADLVLDESRGVLGDTARAPLDGLITCIAGMERLVDDLLGFSQLGRKQPSKRPVDATDLVRRGIETLRPQWGDRQVEFRVGDLSPCLGDPDLLDHVFVNLLANAVKFTRHQPVAVVEVGCNCRDGEVVYVVSDNGVGFDMRHADKIFGIFQRLHHPDEFEGTGVGLALVQRIVQRHGGRIWARSDPGRGATFSFTMPAIDLGGRNHAASPAPPRQAPVSVEARAGTPLNVLVVEDDAADLAILLRELRRSGYEPDARRVERAAEFREALVARDWDVVIGDYSLPDYSAPEALSDLRASGIDIPFILVSGGIGDERAAAIMKAGAHDFVRKGQMGRLGVALEREMAEARARREHREAVERVRASEERFRSLVTATAAVVWTADATGSPIGIQESWLNYTGQRADEPLGDGWARALHPEDRELAMATWGRAVAQGSAFEFEARLWHAARALHRHCVVRGVPVLDRDGAVREWIGTINDVHERAEAQKQLLRQTRELERSNRDLEQFTYISSHDLKEPLRMVRMHMDLLETQCGEVLDEPALRFMRRASEGAARMQQLIDDILQYSLLGRDELAGSPVDLSEVVSEVIDGIRPEIERQRAEIAVGVLPMVHGQRPQLIQLFQNLISNAMKFHNEATPVVEIRAEPRDDEWIVSICDHGIGIDPSHQDQIFDMFRRLHTRSEFPGTGIGLAICKRIVERHGGRIWIESEPGQGATFRFTLPAGQGSSEP